MQTTLALAALVAGVAAQGVTQTITPTTSAPAGCSPDFTGDFEITAVNSTIVTARSLVKRACGAPGSLTIGLAGGVLTDAQSRTGYIANNFQFQFDGPPQAGAIFTGGFSVCGNNSLALGGSAVFYECLSGSFFNLYDRPWAPQCKPILIEVLPCDTTADPVGQGTDGQPTGTSVLPPVTQISDGQPQAASAIPITEIGDGQPQIPTGLMSQIAQPAPVTQISDGQPQVPTASPAPVTEISDGQPQVPTASPAPVTEISDGQPQVPTASPAPITEISDGQPQGPTAAPAPITQISDGQPQAPTATPAPITQISDGQPQAPTTLVPITQISDGQIQAPNSTAPPAPATTSTAAPSQVAVNGGNAFGVGSSLAAAVAGFAAIVLL